MRGNRFLTLVVALTAITWGVDKTLAAGAAAPEPARADTTETNKADAKKPKKRITAADKKAAAKRAARLGLRPGVAGRAAQARKQGAGAFVTQGTGTAVTAAAPPLPGNEGPGGIPHYFGPYGNWAYSPLPKGPVATVTLVDGGSGYNAPLVFVDDAYGTATTQATVTATAVGGTITALTLNGGGAAYSAPVVTITDDPTMCGVFPQPPCGAGAIADAVIGGPFDVGSGMPKFVDKLPGLGPGAANVLGQYIPVAAAEHVTFSGQAADYYEIALVEFTEKMHSSLPATRLRGYVQLHTATMAGTGIALNNPDGTPILKPDGTQAMAVEPPHSLGPVIVAHG